MEVVPSADTIQSRNKISQVYRINNGNAWIRGGGIFDMGTENQGRGWLKSGRGSGSDTGFKYHPGDCQR